MRNRNTVAGLVAGVVLALAVIPFRRILGLS